MRALPLVYTEIQAEFPRQRAVPLFGPSVFPAFLAFFAFLICRKLWYVGRSTETRTSSKPSVYIVFFDIMRLLEPGLLRARWRSLEFPGTPWRSLVFPGELPGALWRSLPLPGGPSGVPWRFLAFPGASFGVLWRFLAPPQSFGSALGWSLSAQGSSQ